MWLNDLKTNQLNGVDIYLTSLGFGDQDDEMKLMILEEASLLWYLTSAGPNHEALESLSLVKLAYVMVICNYHF